MHIANIYLFSFFGVLLAFLVSGAFASGKNAYWRHYEQCFTPPPSREYLRKESERFGRRADRFFGVALALWLSTATITALESQATGLLALSAILSASSVPFCRAMAELSKKTSLEEADLHLYRKVDALSENPLARVYLDAVRQSGRGWLTRVEVERLEGLVREDEFRRTRAHCLSSRR